jgi:BolA family transcriptional regulator, general stress-responsive regulator
LNQASWINYDGQSGKLQHERANKVAELGPIGKTIVSKLTAALAPTALSVIDESHQHAGHSGSHALGESHFRVRITAATFRGQTRVQQHRTVNAILADELKGRVHALAIEAQAPAA